MGAEGSGRTAAGEERAFWGPSTHTGVSHGTADLRVVFAGLLMRFRMKLNRLRKEGRRLAARVLERCLGQPGLAASPARQSRSDAPEMVAGATNAGGAP